MTLKLFGILIGALACVESATADDWPAFRGPSGNGVSSEKSAPTEWGPEKNIKWKVALPRPCDGSPIVSNGRVFVACAEDVEGKKRSLYCFDRKDGKQLWVKTVEVAKVEETHPDNMYCGTTPAADGKRVVVWHGSGGLHCYDFEGKDVWKRELGEFEHIWGYGTSPIIQGDRVILNTGPSKQRVFVTALKLETGEKIWEADEPFKGDGSHNEDDKYMGSWCTPVVVTVDGKEEVLCSQPTRVVAYAPADGKVLWWCDGLRFKKGDLSYSSPVVAGGLCLSLGGFNGPRMAVRMDGTGDVSQTHRAWRIHEGDRTPQSIGTGVFVEGFVYWPYASPPKPTIECFDPKTGKVAWSEPMKAPFWSSMVSAAGRIYVTDQAGTTLVLKPNPEKYELIASNALGEKGNSTPAFSNGEIFIRTFKHLYCIAE